MDDRLGVFANVNYSKFETKTDLQQPQTSGNAGPFRNADFDQSPEKTFTYDPSIVDPTATAGNFRVFGAGGVPVYASLSPIEILTKVGCSRVSGGLPCGVSGPDAGAIERHSGGRQRPGHCPDIRLSSAANNRTAAQLEQTQWIADLPEPMERLRAFAHSFAPTQHRGGKVLGRNSVSIFG